MQYMYFRFLKRFSGSSNSYASAGLLLIMICVSVLPVFAFQSMDDDLRHGNYQAAIAAYNQALQTNPSDRQAQAGLLKAYLETGKYSEAETSAKQFLSKGSDSRIHYYLGEVY